MKDDEKRFFRLCYKACRTSIKPQLGKYYFTPRDVIAILEPSGFIHRKRAWYLLAKWANLGFYEYGVTLDLGWFYPPKLPERYKALLKPEVVTLDTIYFNADTYVID